MKNLYLLPFLLVFWNCNSMPESNAEESKSKIESEKPATHPDAVSNLDNSMEEILMGTWKLDYKEMDIIQLITYNTDGTYQMTMGSREINGTWELMDSLLITKSSPEAKGQKKTIIKIDSKDLWTIWEQESGSTKELKYVRVEEE